MVTRKPVGPPLSTSAQSSSKANPPYPTSPVLESGKTTASSNTNSVYSPDLSTSPAFDLIDVKEARQRGRSDSDASSNGTWDSDDSEPPGGTPEEVEVPQPLKVRGSQQNMKGRASEGERTDELPASLRIGPGQGKKPAKQMDGHGYEEVAQTNPWAGEQPKRQHSLSNNPYLRQGNFVGDSSEAEWQEVKPPQQPTSAPPPPPPPSNAPPPVPVELPAVKSPSEELTQMSLDDRRPASWETAEILTVPQQGQSPLPPVTDQNQSAEQRPVSAWWQDSEPEQQHNIESAFAPPAPPPKAPTQQQEEYAPPSGPPPCYNGSSIGHESAPQSQHRPAPISTQQPPTRSSDAVPETPGTQLSKQRNKTYQIKHVNWYDSADAKAGMRNSPILTQNANGPCPLLALVNALVLSTPRNLDTPLIEVLRAREELSLGLLLDAVFDELMSGRRGDTQYPLPDVSELYSFLLALHTGMNVNPRFVTPATTPRGSLDGHPNGMTSVHPMHRSQMKAGAFEETREMRLYSTFNIPLIHGWTAPADTPAYEAFARSAQSFEDAQNIQFMEAELQDRMWSEGLPPQEQQMLEDIETIKSFLNTWPTQLTDFGLETIAKTLHPGQTAILFRNDHFSTIYKEPKHGALMTLVTDTGYSSHDEIVWESLVDVNGSASEMFSGDFRVVSHGQDVRLNQGNAGGGEDGWQTVQSRNQYHGQRNSGAPPEKMAQYSPPPLPGPRPQQGSSISHNDSAGQIPVQTDAMRKAAEQEDHDLALALQLQEEEEDQQRQAQERRRREQELSEQFLSNETEGQRPPVPPRRNGGRGGGSGPNSVAATTATSSTPTGRAAVSRPTDEPSDPDAPPSYEQAASDRPYRPAGATAAASMSQGNPLGAYDALRRQQAASASDPPASTAAINSLIGQASPPYTATATTVQQNRRRSDAARLRRQSQIAASGVGGPAGASMPGGYPLGQQQGQQGQRVNQAAGVKEAEDKCCVM